MSNEIIIQSIVMTVAIGMVRLWRGWEWAMIRASRTHKCSWLRRRAGVLGNKSGSHVIP